ncbi:uncharacterized protein TNCT_586921 [Trichonephila clavata]|uniref:Uncharacterized protein n=1 Tax=Trichonephila clavata TaxID=2740835 RepID=A0A8X6GFR0_TRICU|nr:uncharacterized protein TNCT_586921 [Trichonephila clavata]
MAKEIKDSHPRCDACDYQKLKNMENNPAVRELRDKIEQLNFRLTECKTENQMLKRNLQLAKQMVVKEVGEASMDFKELLKHGTEPNFRGRLENVLLLKKKVHDLQEHLNKLEGKAPVVRETPSEVFTKKQIPKDRKAFWRMELERRLARENAEKQMSPISKECNELRKKLDAEKARFRDLNGEVNLLRVELQSQVSKNEEDMGLVQSFRTIENQLQETLTERAKLRESLAGYKARNKRLEEEIDSMKEELQILYNKAKDNNMIIDTLTNKHKQMQEAIEAEKSIVRQNVERYKDELKNLRISYDEDVKILHSLQTMTVERNDFIDVIKKDIESGFMDEADKEELETEPKPDDETSVTNESTEPEEKPPNAAPKNEAGVDAETTSPEKKCKVLQMMIDCAKYETLLGAAHVENERLQYVISVQEKQMNDIAMKVVETGRIIMQKNAEKEELSEKIKKLQKSISEKRKKSSVFTQTRNHLEDLAIKIEAQREENEFLRSFLQTAVEKKFEDFDLYRTFVNETKEFFVNALQEIKANLKQKEESYDVGASATNEENAPV